MDWIIGDSVVTPIEHAHLFSENIAQLDGSVFCWSPIDDYPLPKQRSTDAGIVFGSFNNVMKLTPYTIQIWASILKAHPNSQLLLKAPSLRDQSVIERFKGIFRNEGIQDEQLEFEGPTGLEHMMQRYGDVDIALDHLQWNHNPSSHVDGCSVITPRAQLYHGWVVFASEDIGLDCKNQKNI